MTRATKYLMVVTVATVFASPLSAQTAPGLRGDLIKDITELEEKLTSLGNALTVKQYEWSPGTGVRSVGEVLMHVAADNYFMPAAMGTPAPARTKITATDFAAMQTFERQKLDKAATLAEMKTSFDHLKMFIAAVPESRMNETIKVFGSEYTVRAFLILATTHLHEHLGQMIAYARSNGVKPSWSR